MDVQVNGEEATPPTLVDIALMEVILVEDAEMSLPILVELKVVEATPMAVLLALPLIAMKEEVQVDELLVLALLVELAIIKVVKEEETIIVGLLMLKSMAKGSPGYHQVTDERGSGRSKGTYHGGSTSGSGYGRGFLDCH